MTYFNYEELKTTVMAELKKRGIEPTSDALRSLNCLSGRALAQAVLTKLTVAGHGSAEDLTKAFVLYAPSLAKNWHGRDVMANRIVNTFLRSLGEKTLPADSTGSEERDGEADPNGTGAGEGDGDGDGDQGQGPQKKDGGDSPQEADPTGGDPTGEAPNGEGPNGACEGGNGEEGDDG